MAQRFPLRLAPYPPFWLAHHSRYGHLLRLLRVTQFFTNELTYIFQLDTQEGKRNFDILKEAYISVRYRDNYQPDESTVEALYCLRIK